MRTQALAKPWHKRALLELLELVWAGQPLLIREFELGSAPV